MVYRPIVALYRPVESAADCSRSAPCRGPPGGWLAGALHLLGNDFEDIAIRWRRALVVDVIQVGRVLHGRRQTESRAPPSAVSRLSPSSSCSSSLRLFRWPRFGPKHLTSTASSRLPVVCSPSRRRSTGSCWEKLRGHEELPVLAAFRAYAPPTSAGLERRYCPRRSCCLFSPRGGLSACSVYDLPGH